MSEFGIFKNKEIFDCMDQMVGEDIAKLMEIRDILVDIDELYSRWNKTTKDAEELSDMFGKTIVLTGTIKRILDKKSDVDWPEDDYDI